MLPTLRELTGWLSHCLEPGPGADSGNEGAEAVVEEARLVPEPPCEPGLPVEWCPSRAESTQDWCTHERNR